MSDTESEAEEEKVNEEEELDIESDDEPEEEEQEVEDEDVIQDVDQEPMVEKPEQTRIHLHKTVIYVEDPKTPAHLTKTELVELIGVRAGQIAARSTIFVDIARKDGGVIDNPVEIAKLEIAQRKCPLSWRRVVKTTTDKTGYVTEYIEVFDVNKMSFASM